MSNWFTETIGDKNASRIIDALLPQPAPNPSPIGIPTANPSLMDTDFTKSPLFMPIVLAVGAFILYKLLK